MNEDEAEQGASTVAIAFKLDRISIGDDTVSSTELGTSLSTA